MTATPSSGGESAAAGPSPQAGSGEAAAPPNLHAVLHSAGYQVVLLFSAIVGIPVSFVAFYFLAMVHEAEHLVWDTWPTAISGDGIPAWWPVVVIGLAGLLVGLIVVTLPGNGGHVPASGIGAGITEPRILPGVLLAAAASLILGAVVGPEAPLIALGCGLALLAAKPTKLGRAAQAVQLIGIAGSCAAIAAIFGNPVVAVVLMLEVLGLGGQQVLVVLLPCIAASGVGALSFTGLGDWTGLQTGSLAIPSLTPASLDAADLAYAVPLAAVVAVGAHQSMRLGRLLVPVVARATVRTTTLIGLAVGCLAGGYTLLTDRPPTDVALSGESSLGTLLSDTTKWSVATLVLLLLFKGVAYGLCLSSFRGGPVFPSLFLGSAAGVLAGSLPGLGTVPAVAIGMAAATVAILRLPVTSIVLVVLLFGPAATGEMPLILLATVVALVTVDMVDRAAFGGAAAAETGGSASGERGGPEAAPVGKA